MSCWVASGMAGGDDTWLGGGGISGLAPSSGTVVSQGVHSSVVVSEAMGGWMTLLVISMGKKGVF